MARRLILTFAAAALPLLLFVTLLANNSLSVSEESARIRMQAIVQLAQYAVNTHMEDLKDSVAMTAHTPEVSDAARRLDPIMAQRPLQLLKESDPDLDRVLVTDPYGICWASFPEAPCIGGALSSDDWFQGVKESRKPFASHSHFRRNETFKIISFAAPIRWNGLTVGYLVGQVRVTSFRDEIDRAIGGWQGDIVLLDRDGEIAAFGQTIPKGMTAAEMISGGRQETWVKLTQDSSETFVTAGTSVPSFAGALIAQRNLDEATQGTRTLVRWMYVMALGTAGIVTAAVGRLDARRRRMERLQREEAQQRELSERKSDFVALVAHELRNPMTSIKGFASLILGGVRGRVPDEIRRDLATVTDRAEFVIRLVNTLLDVSKIEAGRMPVNPESVSVLAVAQRVLPAFEPQSRERTVRLVLDVDRDLPPAWADPAHVEQVMTNLISNALKFTEQGSITLRARAESECCRVEVIDTGPGMSSEDVARLFERYTSIRRPRTAVQKGTGLGLYLSRQLVELQGGRLEVDSAPGRGTTVWFTLPTKEKGGA